jgi:hypothetical protein
MLSTAIFQVKGTRWERPAFRQAKPAPDHVRGGLIGDPATQGSQPDGGTRSLIVAPITALATTAVVIVRKVEHVEQIADRRHVARHVAGVVVIVDRVR